MANADPKKVFYKDSKGRVIKHKRGEPVFVQATGTFTEDTFSAADLSTLIPQRYVGNEPRIYFGGEPVLFTAADPVPVAIDATRVGFKGRPADVIATNALFSPSAAANDVVRVTLDAGANDFTVVTTLQGGAVVDGGGGADRFAVRAINGPTTINGDAGADVVYVGSSAGFWKTSEVPEVAADAAGVKFLNVRGHGNLIAALLTVDGGAGSDLVTVDDTTDTANSVGTLSRTLLSGIFAAGGAMSYSGLEQLDVHLGDPTTGNTMTIQSTHGTAAVPAVTNVDMGHGGADTVNVMSIAGPTTITTGTGDDVVRVGSRTDLGDPSGLSTLDDIDNALLTLLAGGGADTLLYDSGDTAANTGRLGLTTLTGLGMTQGIEYHGFETLEARLSRGVDDFRIGDDPVAPQGVGAAIAAVAAVADTPSRISVFGGDGADNIRLSGDVSAEQINIYAGAGNDTVTLNPGGPDNPPLTLAGHTRVFGEAGEDLLIVNRLPSLMLLRDRLDDGTPALVRDTVDLDGGAGTDNYVVNTWGSDAAGAHDYIVNVFDSGAPDDSSCAGPRHCWRASRRPRRRTRRRSSPCCTERSRTCAIRCGRTSNGSTTTRTSMAA